MSFQLPPKAAYSVITPSGTYILCDSHHNPDKMPLNAESVSHTQVGYLVIPLKMRDRAVGDAGLKDNEVLMPLGPTLYYAQNGIAYWNSRYGALSTQQLLVNHADAILKLTAWSDAEAYHVVKTKWSAVDSAPALNNVLYYPT